VSDSAPRDALDVTLREFTSGQRLFGRYTLVKILGRGGMGIVWLARDEELEREVALKFLPDLIMHDRALLNELKRETKRSLELTHKNIVRIYDFVHDERSGCISMEYIDGKPLSNLRAEKEEKVFEPNELSGWISQLCDALDYAHNYARIIHRDLKPANLMVNQRGDLKVSDFGIARSLGDTVSRLTMEQGRSGTLVYMSPQQLDGERATHLDDIYSLGATLYDLLTSKPPFYSGNIDRQIHERIAPSMTERRKEFNIEPALVPQSWEDAVAACLAKDPTQRPQSAAEVAQRLQLSLPQTRTLRTRTTRPVTKIAITAGVAAVCLIAIAGWYFTKSQPRVQPATFVSSTPAAQAAAVSEKSIAVLPFENMSAEKEDAFFADGIQDDVLTTLGKVKELTVIARASVMAYRGRAIAGKLREIGQVLGVSHVLEGSVRRSGNHVVINVQLVDTRNDKQVWSERYERSLTDALSLQGEVAVEIARELQATLTPNEMSIVTTKPTENAEAYLLYLRARELELRFPRSDADEEAATKLYQQAVDLDPTFALARTRLSIRASNGFESSLDKGPEGDPILKAKALAEAEDALRLRPRLGEARLALAYYYLFVTRDFDRALTELSQAEELMPNSAEVWQTRGIIYKRQNKLRERIAALRRAEILDPRDTNGLVLLMFTLRAVRDWPGASQTRYRIWALLPEVPARGKFVDAFDQFRLTGKMDSLKQVTSQAPTGRDGDTQEDYMLYGFEVAMLERDFVTAERLLRELPAKAFNLETRWRPAMPYPKAMEEALLGVARGGDRAGIERTLISARQEVEKLVAASPNDGGMYSNLGLIDAFLGRKDDAIREGRRAVEIGDLGSLERNDASAALALIYAWAGESDRAIELIEHLLTVPAVMFPETIYNMTVAELKWRWGWDPLRNDPRFQKIIAGPEPKTVY